MVNAYRSISFISRIWLSSQQPSPKEVALLLDSNTILSRDSIEAYIISYTENTIPENIHAIESGNSLLLYMNFFFLKFLFIMYKVKWKI